MNLLNVFYLSSEQHSLEAESHTMKLVKNILKLSNLDILKPSPKIKLFLKIHKKRHENSSQ